ncbi:MAG: Electron transport complex protein RnfC [Firmicutes bacterium ADurb.Bin467]|nr:MAG: Electron transport complex protein RnfC [Firmicutes bacterium ADurb.Bin467]
MAMLALPSDGGAKNGEVLGLKRTLISRRGVHPHEAGGGKRETGTKPIERAARPSVVAIPLTQHIGASCKPLVKPGDKVLLGQKIGEPDGFMSVAVHASVSGVVKGIQPRTLPGGQRADAIVIESDGLDQWDPSLKGADDLRDPAKLIAMIREAGIVGMGGAAFPTHVKLSVPKDRPIDYMILNGAECEPYLSCDHRVMLEETEEALDGLEIAAGIVGAKRKVVGIELNKPDAIEAMRKAAEGKGIEVRALKTKYPQGGERQMIEALTGRQVVSGKLPMDAGCVVINVSTAAAISRAIRKGLPIVERVVTVAGAVKEPKNLRVRIGVDIESVIEQAGGAIEGANKIVLGGPMMGLSGYNPNTPITKCIGGVLVMVDRGKADRPRGNCIRCGKCVAACPAGLMPLDLYALSNKEFYERARDERSLADCIECGCCDYVCPSKLPIVHFIRVAKHAVTRK